MDRQTAETLGRRLAALEGFRREGGMLWQPSFGQGAWRGEWRFLDKMPEGDLSIWWPDLRDAATRGCVLEMVRIAQGAPAVSVHPEVGESDEDIVWAVRVLGRHGSFLIGKKQQTEAEALVSALEAHEHY